MIKVKNTQELSDQVLKLYKASFPTQEQIPLELFKQLLESKKTSIDEFYDDNNFIGFIMFSPMRNYIYLAYFAIDPNLRSKGYGSKILQEFMKQHQQAIIAFGIEQVTDFNDNNDQKTRRYNFYKKNGLYLNDFIAKTHMGVFNIMSSKPIDMDQLQELTHGEVPYKMELSEIKKEL